MLQRFGFLRRAADPQHVGIMHQLVQKAVRQHVMALASACGVPQAWVPRLVDSVESVLYAAFQSDTGGINANEGRKQWLRMLSPCVERWGANWSDDQCQPLATAQRLAVACSLKDGRGRLLHTDGHHGDASQCYEEVLAFCKRVLPPDHPDIGSSMNNLAQSYSHLGRHRDALKLQEETLAFRKRVLPPDHPDIASSMHNLAVFLASCGRLQEAFAFAQQTLQFRKQVLPPNHPDISQATTLVQTMMRLLTYDPVVVRVSQPS